MTMAMCLTRKSTKVFGFCSERPRGIEYWGRGGRVPAVDPARRAVDRHHDSVMVVVEQTDSGDVGVTDGVLGVPGQGEEHRLAAGVVRGPDELLDGRASR